MLCRSRTRLPLCFTPTPGAQVLTSTQTVEKVKKSMCVYPGICACRDRRSASGVSPLLFYILFFGLTDWLDWLANELQASTCLHPSSSRVMLSCLHRCWGTTLRISCLFCALSTEPSSQPSNFISETRSCHAPWTGLELLILLSQLSILGGQTGTTMPGSKKELQMTLFYAGNINSTKILLKAKFRKAVCSALSKAAGCRFTPAAGVQVFLCMPQTEGLGWLL